MLFEPATFAVSGFEEAINEIEKLTGKKAVYLMVNILPPNVKVPLHTDTLPRPVERWHLVLQTNPQAWFWDQVNGRMHFELGTWVGPIRYDVPHQIWNEGKTDRIHLVVDLATYGNLP